MKKDLEAKILTWTLPDAVEIIRLLEPGIRELGYHTMLGGSVLHKGESQKDLDIFFSPLNGYDSHPDIILVHLMREFGVARSIRDSPDYQAGDPWYWSEMHYFIFENRRIDVFIQ